jgi:hypothetical protein
MGKGRGVVVGLECWLCSRGDGLGDGGGVIVS